MEILYERPDLYDLQYYAFFCPERYAVCEASTKAGKTHGCICWILERAITHSEGTWHWWVAPVLGQARLAFRRLIKELRPYKSIITINRSLMEVHIKGAGSIAFKTAEAPDSLYGEDVYSMVTDEASRCKVEAFYAMRSTLTFTQGLWRLIGNVKGRANEFYRMAQMAKGTHPPLPSGEGWTTVSDTHPNMRYTKITAYDAVRAGVLPAEEIEDAKSKMPEAAFRELYLAEPGEDGGNPFGYAAIEACKQPAWFIPEEDSSTGYPVGCESIGIDLAKSKDYTTIVALDDAGNVIFFDRFRMDWRPTIDLLATHVRGLRPSGCVLVDSTGVGDPVLENLMVELPFFTVKGQKLSNQTKQQIMEGLAVAIQQNEVSIPDGRIVDELVIYEYVYTPSGLVRYQAPQGEHDDCVVALALANKARTEEVIEWDW